jgi:hypothetical protein
MEHNTTQSSETPPRFITEPLDDSDKVDPMFRRLVDIERKYREVRNTIVERFDNWLIVVIAGVAAGLVVGGVYRWIVALE